MKKVGIYGGTFNPPHIGHISAAQRFKDHLSLDKLIIMPSFIPPHKDYFCNETPLERKEMCIRAFGHIDGAEISDFEINRGGKSYTAITLKAFSSPDTELYFLCGTDMFLTLEQWYEFRTIFNLATICCVRRDNEDFNTLLVEEMKERYIEKYGARIVTVPCDVIEISSTEVREALKSEKNYNKFITREVYEYITEKGLYK